MAGGGIIGFIPFPRVLVLCEMQSVSSRIWTRVAVSISYDDNYYTTVTSWSSLSVTLYLCLYLSVYQSLSLSLSLSLSVSLPLSVCLPVCQSACLSVYLCLSLYFSLAICLNNPPHLLRIESSVHTNRMYINLRWSAKTGTSIHKTAFEIVA